jgi:hypothetical protein
VVNGGLVAGVHPAPIKNNKGASFKGHLISASQYKLSEKQNNKY